MAKPAWMDEKMAGRISEKIVSTEYEFAACILPFENRFFFLDESKVHPLLLPFLDLPYSGCIQEIVVKYSAPEQRGQLAACFSLPVICAKLKESPVCEFVGRGYYPDGTFTAKKHRMYYFEGDSRIILYTRTDITKDILFTEQQNQTLRAIRQEASVQKQQGIQFLSTLCHNVGTPLNGVTVAAQLLKRSACINSQEAEYIQIIEDSARRLDGTFANLITLLELQNDSFHFQPKEIDIKKFIRETAQKAEAMAAARHHSFVLHEAEIQSCTILGDLTYLRNTCRELLENALKFSPEGTAIEAEISERPSDDPSITCYRLVVRDHGCGMDADTLSHICEPFFTAAASQTDARRGIGLGLPVIKRLLEAKGGTFRIESKTGEGTEVALNWPAQRVPEPSEIPHAASGLSLSGMHLLLAEDQPVNAKMEQILLEKHGAAVTWAENGKAAYETFLLSDSGYFSAILMDLQMPVMNGYDATKAIRESAHPQARAIPILSVSANTLSSDVQHCLDIGMNAHIAKPIDTTAMVAAIRDCMTRQDK